LAAKPEHPPTELVRSNSQKKTSRQNSASSASAASSSQQERRPSRQTEASTAGVETTQQSASSTKSTDSEILKAETAKLGKAVILDVLGPVIAQISERKDVGSKEKEALSLVRKGFEDLIEANPSLGWKVVEGLLEGINE
jgi:serine/threonine-protein kinase 24/25/MST4